MAIDFPNSPTNNEVYTVGNRSWVYNSSLDTWTLQSSALLGANTVTTSEIADGTIATGDIANDAIETAKIANSAVTAAKLATDSVVEASIVNNAVTTGKLGTDVQLGYRNVIINGAMQVAQRGTSVASITTGGYRTADRWLTELDSSGTWTQSVENDAPTGSGFRKSIKMLCTTADASPAAGDYHSLVQRLEGQNLQHFLKGTASAKQFSLSFWVKSNVTGTYIAELVDQDNTRRVSASYTVSASATWEKKTLIFPADTTGTFNNDNNLSLTLSFWLGLGSNYTGGTLQTTWGTSTSNLGTGQTNLAAATNNYWQITGVQLEAGAVATPFEFEDYGTTLNKCFRYFERYNESEYFQIPQSPAQIDVANRCEAHILYSRKRAAPTLTVSNAAHLTCVGVTQGLVVAGTSFSTLVGTGLYSTNIFVNGSGVNALTVFEIIFTNASSGWLAISAEL